MTMLMELFNFCSTPTGLLTLTVLTLIFCYLRKTWWYDPLSGIPGPVQFPVVGYFPFLGAKMHLTLTELWKTYGDVYRIKIGSRRMIVVNGQNALRQALLKNHDFAGRPNYCSYEMSSKDSLVGLNDFSPRYRVGKKLLSKAFGNFVTVRKREMQTVARDAVQSLLDDIKSSGNSPVEITNERLYPIVSVIMGYISWGAHYDREAPEIRHILENGKEFATSVMFGVVCDYFPWAKYLMKSRLAKLEKLFEVQKLHAYRLAAQHVDTYDGKNLRDIADFFQKVSEDMSDEEKKNLNITDDMLKYLGGGAFGAGFGTIAITVKWALLLLAKHPECQRKMQAELDAVVGTDRLPTFDDSKDLPYSMAVINEVYRYSSIAAIPFAHKTIVDTEVSGYRIPKDTVVVCNFYSLHRDPSVFSEPDRFNPERYLGEDDRTLNKNAMEQTAPYGLGTRRCAGELVARLEVFTFITTLVQRCRIEELPDRPLDLNDYKFTLALDPNPFFVKIVSRFNEW